MRHGIFIMIQLSVIHANWPKYSKRGNDQGFLLIVLMYLVPLSHVLWGGIQWNRDDSFPSCFHFDVWMHNLR